MNYLDNGYLNDALSRVTSTGHVQLSDVPEADALISRMHGATPLQAAKGLLKDFGLESYIK